MRRVLHTQDNTLSQGRRFRENIGELGRRGLRFDMCFRADQLSLAAELADAAPDTLLMLDHCGVPDIAGRSIGPWKKDIAAVAQRENVHCKLSGIVAYAKPDEIRADTFQPWFMHVLECFGADRIVWGSDWPVCNLTASLKSWNDITHQLLQPLSADEQERILVSNACAFYDLAVSANA